MLKIKRNNVQDETRPKIIKKARIFVKSNIFNKKANSLGEVNTKCYFNNSQRNST